ncbi:MAG: helix-turn-helix transcriptional regulator [Ruminococcus sp.]|uniref:helix-turn-helix domain-containing protein n=1 Tax=Ruminococcus sp. TaxID=41978 RepID=UPI0028733436|nr:helix-turn-helix transcriptional regulator [Ruminococcus sp.]MBQ3284005.1 helix-turn-helix transcriptional regulator [Ruminococcus sp.]
MNKDFARNITFLRKERKLSQKQAALELGISQALLSHYEKGIRECSLDFVVKAADYYNVSCDYLLGRTADREYDISESIKEELPSRKQSAAQIVNRRLIASMMNVIYDFAATAKNRRLDRTINNYFMIMLYRVFRRLYSANGENPTELFKVPKEIYSGYAYAVMDKYYTDIGSMTDKDSAWYLESFDRLNTSPEQLAEEYPDSASEIFNVIQQAENSIQKLKF